MYNFACQANPLSRRLNSISRVGAFRMYGQELLVAELIALRSSIVSLAREVLANQGSDAFLSVQQRAENLAANCKNSHGLYHPKIREQATKIVGDIFNQADNGS